MRRGRSIGFALAAAGLLAIVSGCGPSQEALKAKAIEDQKFVPPVPVKPPPPAKGQKGPGTAVPGPNVKGHI
jgi:hypothetical protein